MLHLSIKMTEKHHSSEKSDGIERLLASDFFLNKIPRSQPTQPVQESSLQHGMDFSCLPEVVLLSVFEYLDTQDRVSVAKVCSRWRNVAYNATLWKGVVPLLRPDSMTTSVVASLKTRGIRAAVVAENCKPHKMHQLVKVAALESLLWSVSQTRRKLIEAFRGDWPAMKHLSVHVDSVDAAVTDYLGECMPNLEHLQLWGFMEQDIFTRLDELKNVNQLELVHAGRTPLPLEETLFELKAMPSLTDLRVIDVEVNDKFLVELKYTCPNLQSLVMNKCVEFSDQSLNQIANATNLQKLTIRFTPIQDCPPVSPEHFANLKVLAILNAKIWDDDMGSLAELPALEILCIRIKNITWVGWMRLGGGFKKLKVIELIMCQRLSQWKASCLRSLPCLQEFRLQCLTKKHPRNFQLIGQALPHLRRLQLRGDRTWPKDRDMKGVAAMKSLEGLSLTQCPKVSDEGMRFLAKGCAPLQCLSLRNTRVTKEGLYYLASHKTLTRLSIKTPKVYAAGLLMQKFPNLQVLTADVDGSTKRRLKQQKPGLVLEDFSRCCARDEFGL